LLKAATEERLMSSQGDSESRPERTFSGSLEKKEALRELTEFRLLSRSLRPPFWRSGMVGSESEAELESMRIDEVDEDKVGDTHKAHRDSENEPQETNITYPYLYTQINHIWQE